MNALSITLMYIMLSLSFLAKASCRDESSVAGKVILYPCIQLFDHQTEQISFKDIKNHLTRARIVDELYWQQAPTIIGFKDDHLIGGINDVFYTPNFALPHQKTYQIFRQGAQYTDHDTDEFLAQEVQYIGQAVLEKNADVAIFHTTEAIEELQIGDKLLESDAMRFNWHYSPQKPSIKLQGHIVGFAQDISQSGKHSVVVIDKGLRDGLAIGDQLTVYQAMKHTSYLNELPEIVSGVLLIFHPFEKVSYALVIKANRSIHLFDLVKSF